MNVGRGQRRPLPAAPPDEPVSLGPMRGRLEQEYEQLVTRIARGEKGLMRRAVELLDILRPLDDDGSPMRGGI